MGDGFIQALDKTMQKPFSLLFVLLALFWACSDDGDVISLDMGYDYYPLDESIRIYDVEQITFNALGSDTSRFQMREFISDSLVSEAGEVSYVLKREIRFDAVDEWQVDSLWAVRRPGDALIITEGNTSFIKLVFPVPYRCCYV